MFKLSWSRTDLALPDKVPGMRDLLSIVDVFRQPGWNTVLFLTFILDSIRAIRKTTYPNMTVYIGSEMTFLRLNLFLATFLGRVLVLLSTKHISYLPTISRLCDNRDGDIHIIWLERTYTITVSSTRKAEEGISELKHSCIFITIIIYTLTYLSCAYW